MLNKLLKYDLKSMYKVLTVFYALALIFALLTRIFWSINNSTIFHILGTITSIITITLIFSILINNIMRAWARFIKNIYGDESYLTHTLPMTKSKIHISKFLSTLITVFTSVFIILMALFIAYYSKENLEMLKLSLKFISNVYNTKIIYIILIIGIAFFLEIAFIIESGYTGIIIGHKSNNNKITKSVIYGFICYIIISGLSLLFIFILGLLNKDIMNLFITNEIPEINIINKVMYFAIILYTFYIIILFIINNKLFNKGVNVD